MWGVWGVWGEFSSVLPALPTPPLPKGSRKGEGGRRKEPTTRYNTRA
ncbi:MAG: hypothetical protein F6J93_21070 [Oscillatoria sp. SIO1A7]|nr:hypothetical protein [Oscillatoria sp. SIO1A7]